MRSPCSCSMRLSAKPPVIASRTLAISAPPRWHSSSASATAPIVTPTIIWLASLASCPAPCGPTWVLRPNTLSTSCARVKSSALPPAIITRLPASAPTVPPDTGQSIWLMPSAAKRAAWSRASRGLVLAMSMTSALCALCSVPRALSALSSTMAWAAPCANITSPVTSPFSSMQTTVSAPCTACAAVSNMRAPKGVKRSALSRLRLNACTVWPAWHKRRAIGKPINPIPKNAMVIMNSVYAMLIIAA